MPSAADFEETQALDSNSPAPGDGLDDAMDDGGLMDADLFGETQALEDPDFGGVDGNVGICDWGKTQVVDDGIDQVTQITEVLSDVEEINSEQNQRGDEENKEAVVDSDPLLSDNKSREGLLKRTFTAVRAAALRSSGLAALSNTPRRADANLNSAPSNAQFGGTRDVQPDTRKDLIDHEATAGEKVLNNEPGASEKCMGKKPRDEYKSRSNNSRVKKLFNEVTPEEEVTGNIFAGLSYVGSQDPGSQSQANALDVVDNFLLINDVGLSENILTDNVHKMKSPPVSNAKGARYLAQRVELRSPVGKAGAFEWVDSLEDEGGGDFFVKMKDSFFEDTSRSKKSKSLPQKAKRLLVGTAENAEGKEKECMNESQLKTSTLSCSDSRLMIHKPSTNDRVQMPELKSKKNLFKDFDEQSRPELRQQQSEATDAHEGVEATFIIGPDTQMAAEAMEALGQGLEINDPENDASPLAGIAESNGKDRTGKSLLEKDLRGKRPSGGIAETSGKDKRSKCPSKEDLQLKRIPIPDSECIRIQSESKIKASSKLSKGVDTQSKKLCSRLKRDPEETKGIRKAKRENSRLDAQINPRTSDSRKESLASSKGEKDIEILDRPFIKDVNNRRNSITHGKCSNNRKFKDHLMSPIASRTRSSKLINQKKLPGTSFSFGKDLKVLLDGGTPKPVGDGSGQMVCTRSSYSGSEQVLKLGMQYNSPTIDVFNHPKRRRTCKIVSCSGASDNNPNLVGPFPLFGEMQATIAKPPTKERQKAYIKSVRGILDKAIQKKRFALSHNQSCSDLSAPNIKVSSVRTRSSLIFLPFKHQTERSTEECPAMPGPDKAVLADAAKNDSIAGGDDKVHADVALAMNVVVSESQVREREVNNKVKQSSSEKVQPSECAAPLKDVNAVSPVCIAENLQRTSRKNRFSKSSIARELMRLETTAATPSQTSKDLRRRKDLARVRVLLSHHLDEDIIKQQKKILVRLGVPMTSAMPDATHFVTDKFVRTRNMLEAMALGKPVVTPMWLESCGQASCFIDEKGYILRDIKKEKEIGFSMPASLARAYECPLLQGRRVYITQTVKPGREVVASLVKAANGQPIQRLGRSTIKDVKISDDLLVISCEEDYAACIPLLEKGVEVFDSELILNGIVIQKLEYEGHRLFLDHVKKTRSTIWLRCEDGAQFVPVAKCS